MVSGEQGMRGKKKEEKIYWLAWHAVLAGQARKFWEIIDFFGSAEQAWHAKDDEFKFYTGLLVDNRSKVLKRRRSTDLDKVAAFLENRNNGVYVLFYGEEDYPKQLNNIFDPPPVLFLRGNGSCLNDVLVALVGSRRASPYGLYMAEKLARELVSAGVGVVSGMARGIDTAAHRGALKGGGKTVAVLGCGVDVIYPRENSGIMKEIAATGAIISEFPPGFQPEPWHFPVRNRIISGLSRIVVVVEAAEKSGALITANVALEQGRDVMAVPGNVTSRQSRGPNMLIKEGAAPVLEARDILDILGRGELFHPEAKKIAGGLKLSDEEKMLSDIIDFEPVPVEILVQKTGLPAAQVMTALVFLEMKGMIRQLPGRLYVRAN